MTQEITRADKLTCVDGLRGTAVGLVILFHLHKHWPDRLGPYCDRMLGSFYFGYCGVSLFFVLSGFCLTYSLLRREAVGKLTSLSSYFASRFHRIAPPYYASILLYLLVPFVKWLLSGELSDDLSLRQVSSHVMFLHGFAEDTLFGLCPAYWTLALEMQFYLILPVLFVCARKWGAAWVVLVVTLVSLIWNASTPSFAFMSHGVFLARWTEFAFGMAVACWFEKTRRPPRVTVEWATLVTSLVLLGLAATTFQENLFGSNLLYGLGFALLLSAVLSSSRRGWGLSRLFEHPWLVWAGGISYSVYLTHVFFQGKVTRFLYLLVPRPDTEFEVGMVLITLATVWIGGWAFYQLVERHFIRSVDVRSPRVLAPDLARSSLQMTKGLSSDPDALQPASAPSRLDFGVD